MQDTLTVSQVSALVKGILAEYAPSPLRVVGEVSNFSDRTHWFFSLKDSQSALRCVCFASSARRAGFKLADGMQVVATGRLDYYDAQGSLQLYVDRLEPVGQGALELKLKALIAELRQLGYFQEERKKSLPLFPRRVAIITSRTGAALQDVINTARRRWAGCRLCLVDVHVQGAEAAPEIARAIEAVNRTGPNLGIEAIILTRGGGSIEDLWAFNERIVADALYRCRLPIVAAIGHETDYTVAEMVADQRASTPTQAAMMLIPDRAALEEQVNQLRQRMAILTHRLVAHHQQQFNALIRHRLFRKPQSLFVPWRDRLGQLVQRLALSPAQRLTQARLRLEGLSPRLDTLMPRRVKTELAQLEAMSKHLESLSPRRVLGRGYSYTLGPDGSVLRDAAQVQAGQVIRTELARGKLLSRVEADGVEPTSSMMPVVSKSQPPRSSPRKSAHSRQTGPTLFEDQ